MNIFNNIRFGVSLTLLVVAYVFVGVATTDNIGYLITFYALLILAGIEKVCLKLESLK